MGQIPTTTAQTYENLINSLSKNQEEVKFDPTSKTSYYKVPESEWDHLPVWKGETPPFQFTKIHLSDLQRVVDLPIQNAERIEIINKLFESLNNHQFFVVTLDEENQKVKEDLMQEVQQFMSKDKEEKQAFFKFDQKDISGWTELVFDNRDNLRDPEHREVFQIRYCELGKINWPSSSFELQATKHYINQWEISLLIAKIIAQELNLSFEHLLNTLSNYRKRLGENVNEEDIKPWNLSESTNLCLFRYTDTHGYKTDQNCMVHQDFGLVTLLPRATEPGIQFLHEGVWVNAERYTQSNEMMVYFGLSMEHWTKHKILPLRHRVIRKPNLERYSIPFELKPNEDAEIVPGLTYKKLDMDAQWARIQNKVARADSVQ